MHVVWSWGARSAGPEVCVINSVAGLKLKHLDFPHFLCKIQTIYSKGRRFSPKLIKNDVLKPSHVEARKLGEHLRLTSNTPTRPRFAYVRSASWHRRCFPTASSRRGSRHCFFSVNKMAAVPPGRQWRRQQQGGGGQLLLWWTWPGHVAIATAETTARGPTQEPAPSQILGLPAHLEFLRASTRTPKSTSSQLLDSKVCKTHAKVPRGRKKDRPCGSTVAWGGFSSTDSECQTFCVCERVCVV